MFITRASRHDKEDVKAFYEAQDWHDAEVDKGVVFCAREGGVIAALRLIEVAPHTIVADDVVVADGRRGQGIGRQLLQAAMNSRGGTIYLSCHEEALGFYGRSGFEQIDVTKAPPEVLDYFTSEGNYPFTEDHVHYFLKAR